MSSFYGDKYPKRAVTTIGIRVSTGLCVVSAVILVVLQPSHGSQADLLIFGVFCVFLALSIFLFLVVETWQTRRLLRFRGGPVVDFKRWPQRYIACLIFFSFLCVALCLYGISQVIRAAIG
jgi:peptidoglycan/LPS O-acetylase OafA/YrhL